MNKFGIKKFVLGELGTNVYLCIDAQQGSCILIDAPAETAPIQKELQQQGLKLQYILLTHGHFDHIGGLDDFDVPYYIHTLDAPYITNTAYNGSAYFGVPFTIARKPLLIGQGSSLDFCGRAIRVIHTPGHTPGGVCYVLDDCLFSGDTLFFHSIGRTDLPLGSSQQLRESINTKLMILPPQTRVFPGHGSATTIGKEKKRKPVH